MLHVVAYSRTATSTQPGRACSDLASTCGLLLKLNSSSECAWTFLCLALLIRSEMVNTKKNATVKLTP